MAIKQNDTTLATKYRPTGWDAVIGQDTTRDILKHQVETETSVGAYLFSGQSGSGKTTSARIFADQLNEGNGHPIEIDAASNNSVEQARIIVQQSKQRSLDSKYRIYIVDEAHTLSSQSWQALLKCIEEPSPFTKFIFCTTNPEKIPDTIRTRVQEFVFNKVSDGLIVDRLKYIISQENANEGKLYTFEEEALYNIAKQSNGSVRQAITNMEKCLMSSPELSLINVNSVLGVEDTLIIHSLLESIINRDVLAAINIIESTCNSGKSLNLFLESCLKYVLDIKLLILSNYNFSISRLKNNDVVKKSLVYAESIDWFIDSFSYLYDLTKSAKDSKTLVEVEILKWCR